MTFMYAAKPRAIRNRLGFVINRPTVAFTEQEPVIAQVAPIPGSQG